METTDSRIAALARLDKTPEQVLAHRRAELEEQIRVLQQKTRFERYADWRAKQLDEEDEVDYLYVVLAYRTIELIVFVLALIWSWKWAWYSAITLEIVHIYGSYLVASKKKGEARTFLQHLFYTLILPLMPLIIAVDIKVSKRNRSAAQWAKRNQIRNNQEEIAMLTLHEVVPSFYAHGIEEARTELLGESSELRKAECELRTHLEDIRTERETFRVRLEMAGDDAERVDPLNSELQELIGCEADLVERSTKHQQTIALTSAILEECERFIGRLPDKLMDHELILRAKSKVAGANHAIQKSEEAVARHIDLVRDRLMQLAAIVSAPQRELPSANPEGDMRTFFAHLDKVAEQVATLEAQKAF
ncbi:MAG: hypothetical protein WCW31_06150 [Patescibacteria group bacterium]|jgi:hypothetical protein